MYLEKVCQVMCSWKQDTMGLVNFLIFWVFVDGSVQKVYGMFMDGSFESDGWLVRTHQYR